MNESHAGDTVTVPQEVCKLITKAIYYFIYRIYITVEHNICTIKLTDLFNSNMNAIGECFWLLYCNIGQTFLRFVGEGWMRCEQKPTTKTGRSRWVNGLHD